MVVSAEQIRKAQDALKARGLNPGTDGKLDERTQQALRDFQKQNNLPATGVLDEKTADKLGIVRDSGSPISPGGRSGSTGATGSSGGMSSGASGSSGATGSTGGSSSPSSGSSLK
jgi:peptidoglycan hydrolase-like protein with peptidoglycan-binding domain